MALPSARVSTNGILKLGIDVPGINTTYDAEYWYSW